MRGYDGVLELRTVLIGTVAVGETHYGAAIDTKGFQDVLGVLMCGAIGGTGGNTGALSVKFQEGGSPTGTGTAFADITDGALNGSMSFADITVQALSSPLAMGKLYEKLSDNNRKRYIRCHASLAGTDGCNVAYSVGVLLGRPVDTLYITDASTQSTSNADFSQ